MFISPKLSELAQSRGNQGIDLGIIKHAVINLDFHVLI